MAGDEGEGRRSTSDEHEMHKGYSSPPSAWHAGMEAIGQWGDNILFRVERSKPIYPILLKIKICSVALCNNHPTL